MANQERRAARRTRTRLRPGKLYRRDGSFLCDCAILNRNPQGMGIRSFEPVELPAELLIIDESEANRWHARRVWGDGIAAGLALAPAADTLSRREFQRVAGPYYAAS